MPVYNHHTPCINISQCSHINTIHPSSELCHNLRCKTIEHREKPQIKRLHFVATVLFDSLAEDALLVDVTPADVAPPWMYDIPASTKHCAKLRHKKTSNFHHAKSETPPQNKEHLATRKLHCRSNMTHSPCTSMNPTTNSLHQHNINNDPSIKILVTNSQTRMIVQQQEINLL